MMQTVKNKMLGRIRRLGPGRAFVAKDFLDIASRGSIDVALAALVRENAIRRVRRGLYDLPKTNPEVYADRLPPIPVAPTGFQAAPMLLRGVERPGIYYPSGSKIKRQNS